MSIVRFIAISLLVVIALAVVGVALLRYRKLRRDEMRALEKRPVSSLAPPPSPYQPSRGVKIIDGGVTPTPRGAPERPRLDPDRTYVFSDLTPSEREALATPRSRHDAQWALERSSHGTRLSPGSARILIGVLGAMVLLIIAGALIRHSSHAGAHASTTSSSTSTTTTTAAPSGTWPTTLTASSYANGVATYAMASNSYTVSVTGRSGPVWVVMNMGPHNTLEYQGKVNAGSTYTLTLTGHGTVSLGSPKNATVSINTHAVVFPSAPSAPLILSLTVPTSG